jgi:hypothetical protein
MRAEVKTVHENAKQAMDKGINEREGKKQTHNMKTQWLWSTEMLHYVIR